MTLQDITTWTVMADHKARPKNQFEEWHSIESKNILHTQFETFADNHVYDCSLPTGEYKAEAEAEDVELVWQLYDHDRQQW